MHLKNFLCQYISSLMLTANNISTKKQQNKNVISTGNSLQLPLGSSAAETTCSVWDEVGVKLYHSNTGVGAALPNVWMNGMRRWIGWLFGWLACALCNMWAVWCGTDGSKSKHYSYKILYKGEQHEGVVCMRLCAIVSIYVCI